MLGRSLNEFANKLGLSTSGGLRGDTSRLKVQATKLFSTFVSLKAHDGRDLAYKNVTLSDEGVLLWNLKASARELVTAIYGDGDALYLGQHAALTSAVQGAPDFRGLHWVLDAGHWVQFERPAAFDALLASILQQGAEPLGSPHQSMPL